MPIRILPLIIVFLFTACSRIPEPITHEYTQQKKMQAVEHWNFLARDVAARLNHELVVYDYLSTPVYVKETCGDEKTPCRPNQTSSFNEAFHDLLITQLVNYGIQTRIEPTDNALAINYKVQIVRHRAKRVRSLPPGTFTALTATILVLRNASSELVSLVTAGAADLLNSGMTDKGNYEILITTSISSSGKYMFRTSDIYYINDEDFWQYQENMGQAGVISLSSPTASTEPKQIETTATLTVTQEKTTDSSKKSEKHIIIIPQDEKTVIEPAPMHNKPADKEEANTDI